MIKIDLINKVVFPSYKANAKNFSYSKFDIPNDSFEYQGANKVACDNEEVNELIIPEIIDNSNDDSKLQTEKLEKFLSNDEETERIIKEFDFGQYGKNGLPLKYSRKDLMNNIHEELDELSDIEKSEVLRNIGINITKDNFEGMPILDQNEKSVFTIINNKTKAIQNNLDNFLNKNEVMIDNEKSKEVLDNLIQGFPEFTSIAQKKQHPTHNYSVDIHTLKVLQDSMNDPLYETLSDEGKTILKTTILMHDLGKKANVIDTGHQYLSSVYSRNILKRFDYSQENKNRITKLIENHHWFKYYNEDQLGGTNLLKNCSNYDDFVICKIFAKADLKNVNDNFMYKVTYTNTPEKYNRYMDEKFNDLDIIAKKKFGSDI